MTFDKSNEQLVSEPQALARRKRSGKSVEDESIAADQ
jgi:hypothetical protein